MSQQKETEQQKAEQPKQTTGRRQEKSTFEEVMNSSVTKQVGRELVRGVFGMLFGTTPRRRSTKRGGGFF